jgi:hypothetical protein
VVANGSASEGSLAIERDLGRAQTMFAFSGIQDGFWRGFFRTDTKDVATILRDNAESIQFDPGATETIHSIPCYRLDLAYFGRAPGSAGEAATG